MAHSLPIYARRLKEMRERAGFSQRGLGIALGLDPLSASPRMNQYERGRREPDLSTLQRLASLLDVPLAFFYCEGDEEAEVLLVLHGMPERIRKAEIGRLRALAEEQRAGKGGKVDSTMRVKA